MFFKTRKKTIDTHLPQKDYVVYTLTYIILYVYIFRICIC